MSQRPTLLYILAPSFSGSTLLTYLLAQHSQISTVGELKATKMGVIDEYRCSCGSLIRECTFWLAVEQQANQNGVWFSVDDFRTIFRGTDGLPNSVVQASVRGKVFELLRAAILRSMPRGLSKIKSIASNNLSLSQIVCDIQGGDIFLDGSKDSTRLLHLIRSNQWDVKVIYLQRDGRGVTNSYKRHRNIDFPAALNTWKRAVSELQKMRARLDDDRVFDLHYEDLCQEPEIIFKRIWAWLGIDDQMIQKMDFKRGEFHILGNTMRLGNVSEIRFDESWKTALSSKELNMFARDAARLNGQIGYEPSV